MRILNEVGMARRRELSGFEIVGWTAMGVFTGLVAGFGLSEWVGATDPRRLTRLMTPRPLPRPAPALSAAATARAATAAFDADPTLCQLSLVVTPVMLGVIELHGWVPSRAVRAHAGRVAHAVAGVDRVVNSLLVHGEDDRGTPSKDRPTNQSA
jgi:hypothetical protein